MRILLTFDDNYAPHATVVMDTAIQNSSEKLDFVIMHFEENLSPIIKEKLLLHFSNRVNSLNFYSVDNQQKECFSQVDFPKGLSLNTFLRLFASSILTEEDAILYLDSDLMVLGDIVELMKLANLNNAVNAVPEHFPTHRIKELESKKFKTERERRALHQESVQMAKKKSLDMSSDAPYFNAGVMIMNLKMWREQNILERFLQFVTTHTVLPCGDQDVLNGIFNGNFGKLPLCWNVHPYIRNLNEYTCGYTKEELKEAVEHPKIIHFAGHKAWEYVYENKAEKELYWKYRAATPWATRKEQGKTLGNIILVNLSRPTKKMIKFLLGERLTWQVAQLKGKLLK